MQKNLRKLLYITTIVAVLFMSAMPSYAVYADDGSEGDPPPATTPAETPAEDPAATTPVEAPPAEEGDPASPPPEVEAPEGPPSEGEAPPEEAAPVEEPVVVPEILEQVPDGTELVVVNEGGQPEPLASETAAEILVEGDPIWCPNGSVPIASTGGCTPSYTTFGDLVTELRTNTTDYNGNGVIWVAASYAGNDNATITFNGANANLARLGDISVLGGWSGISGSTSIDPTNPSVLDERLRFINWTGAISVSNLDVNNAGGGPSLLINTDGDISINNVSVSNNPDNIGARLNNCIGDPCTASGDVSVVDSEFINNDTHGLYVRSSGDVTIENVTTDGNGTDGINIDTNNSAGADITIKDTTATNNTGDGIQAIEVGGNLTLKEVTASDNGADGFRSNQVGGDLTLKSVTASNNGSEGIIINNTQGNVTGSNLTTNENNREGIEIDLTRGNVKLSGVTANDSTLNEGVDIHDTDGNLVLSSVTANNNNQEGIEVVNVDGSLGFYCVIASTNGQDGISVSVDHGFTIKCSQSTDNVRDGLRIAPVAGSSAQLLSFTATGNTGLDINYDSNFTTVTEKTVDCSPKKSSPNNKDKGEKELFTKLYCLPGEIKVALYDTYGDMIEFNNLCGYDAGVFDPSSWAYPETIPGGGDDYITSLQNKMLEEIPNLELNSEYGMAGILAQILDELPFMLPDGFSYASAFFTAVLDEGEFLDPLPEESGLTVRFRVPGWLDPGDELTILYWDGMDWVDLGGEYSEDGYYFQVTTEEIGVFVLAVQ